MKKALLLAGMLGAFLLAPATASAVPGYYCSASAIRATGPDPDYEPVATTKPFRPCEDDTQSKKSLLDNPFGLSADFLEVYTDDFPRRPTPTTATPDPLNAADPKTNGGVARAKLGDVSLLSPVGEMHLRTSIPAGLNPTLISASGLKAQVDTTCAGGPPIRPVNTGSGGVTSLSVNGAAVPVTGTANQSVAVPGVGTLTVNYEQETGTGLTEASPKIMVRRALFLDVDATSDTGAILDGITGDIVIGEAVSGFEGVASPCGIPIPPGA